MSKGKSIVSKLMGLTGLKLTEVELRTKNKTYKGMGYKKSWLNKETVMTELLSVTNNDHSKYFPHQSYQECQRRLSKNG